MYQNVWQQGDELCLKSEPNRMLTTWDMRQNTFCYGGHFEFQDGRPSKQTAISEKAVSECLTLLACSLYQIWTFYNAYNMWYGPKYTLKWRPFWNSKWHLKTCSEKMEPKFFGFSTPKLTKLANKINFGTKISRDFIVASTI